VVTPGDTSALDWELRTIVAEGLHSRLFVLTAPCRRSRRYDVFAYIGLLAAVAMARINGWRTVTWSEFAVLLTACGLRPSTDPGPGAVVAFDAAGRQVLLGKGLHDASAIVRVIATRLLEMGAVIDAPVSIGKHSDPSDPADETCCAPPAS
jgi:hypothetical protein